MRFKIVLFMFLNKLNDIFCQALVYNRHIQNVENVYRHKEICSPPPKKEM